jgi:hypothetical protein
VAWVSEADQRAAGTIDSHMPALPVAELSNSGLVTVSRGRRVLVV